MPSPILSRRGLLLTAATLAVAGGGRDVYVGFTLTGRRVQRYRRGGSGDAPADRPPPQ